MALVWASCSSLLLVFSASLSRFSRSFFRPSRASWCCLGFRVSRLSSFLVLSRALSSLSCPPFPRVLFSLSSCSPPFLVFFRLSRRFSRSFFRLSRAFFFSLTFPSNSVLLSRAEPRSFVFLLPSSALLFSLFCLSPLFVLTRSSVCSRVLRFQIFRSSGLQVLGLRSFRSLGL